MIVKTAIPRSQPVNRHGDAMTPRLPLYLRGGVSTRIDTDGPAFVVERPNKAAARYPFSRVARIVCGPDVNWSASALAACLRQDIPIIFLDRDGKAAGYLHARLRQPSRLDHALTELADRPDGHEIYANWLRSERMRALQDWQRARNEAGQPIGPEEYRELLRRHVYRPDDSTLGMHTADLYESAIEAYVVQLLLRSGVKPLYWTVHARILALAEDLRALVMLRLSLEMHSLGKAMHGAEDAMLTLLHRFGQGISEQVQGLLGRLHKHVREELEQWH